MNNLFESEENQENLDKQFNPKNQDNQEDQEDQELKGTRKFIDRLTSLKDGELGLLRSHSGLNIDKSLQGFDMFTGIWWYLRQQGWAPKRRVAWLIIKLYAQFPLKQDEQVLQVKQIKQESKFTLAKHLRYCAPKDFDDRIRFQSRVDRILLSEFTQLEPHLFWALSTIRQNNTGEIKFDWVKLTNDLSRWDNDTKKKWAKEFLNIETI